ncbi:helix-turn-helix domain-containing protein [Actinomyces wuliandei]|uniref:helix-turn-helix domain-containing protein n=1 Tax=Actinomyces wuliandei TaxID=2057743 RepID=UPI0019D4290D|nr:helix-turn-helix transcriptional regulator [Actinomyces wuliandei]
MSRPDEEARAWTGWPLPTSYPALLSRAQAREVTRHDQAGALAATTRPDPADTALTRVAYIQRESGGRAARAAERAADHAATAADPGHRDHARAQAVQTRFLESWSAARDRWEAEHAAQLAADRLPGPVLRALRTTMGLDQAQLADRLGVATDTVRWWESGRSLINHGATQEVWVIWQDWVHKLDALADTAGEGGVPVLAADTPPATLRAVAVLLAGHRFTTSPGPLTLPAPHTPGTDRQPQ